MVVESALFPNGALRRRIFPSSCPSCRFGPVPSSQVEKALLELAIKTINRLKPEFAIVCGDLINEWPVRPPTSPSPSPHSNCTRSKSKEASSSSPAPALVNLYISSARNHFRKIVCGLGWVGLAHTAPFFLWGRQSAVPGGAGKPGDAAKRAEQVLDFKAITSAIDPTVRLVCVCGNHDVGDAPTRDSIAQYRSDFGKDFFSFWIKGCKCIVTNSQLWKDSSGAPDLLGEHDAWLADELASAADARHVFVFGHVPIFVHAADEMDGYFNIAAPLRTALLEMFAAHGVSHYFCGHFHRNAGGVYRAEPGAKAATVEVVVTGAVGTNVLDKPGGEPVNIDGMGDPVLGKATSGMRLVDVAGGRVRHTWCSFQDCETLGT